MSLNESIIENAALEWSCLRAACLRIARKQETHREIRELRYAVGPQLAPGELAAERNGTRK